MSCQDEIKRIVIKRGTGAATIPATSDHRDGTWLATDIYEGELYQDTATGIIYGRNGSIITINGEGVKAKYTATLTQTGVNAPVATIFVNNIGTIVIAYSGVGRYDMTLTGVFTADRTRVMIGSARVAGDEILAWRRNANVIDIQTYSGGVATNGLLTETAFTIEIFA